MAGIKKLVPSKVSNSIMMAATSNAGNANRPSTVATNMPQIDSGRRIMVSPRQRYCSTVTT